MAVACERFFIHTETTNVEIRCLVSIFVGDKAIVLSKIIIIGSAYPLRGGGLTTYNERLARELIKEGDQVKIYTFSLQYPDFLFPGKTQYAQGPPPEDLDIVVRINSINPINWIKVGKEIKNEKADIILVRYWLPFMAPSLGTILNIAKKAPSKVIAITDNVIPHERRPGDTLLTKYFLKAVDACICMSESVLADLKNLTKLPSKLVTHPLYDNFGVKHEKSEALRKLGLPEGKFVFLFFGFIRKYKGLELLIEAFERLDPVSNNCILLIAGEYYAGEKELSQKIAQSRFKDQIYEHTHFIEDEEVGWYFSASDAVVQPYLHATQSGVTPLAYHFEIPMMVTNVGALPEMVPQDIGIVTEPTVDDILEGLKKMLQFDKQTFNKRIKEEKSKYDWSRMTAAIKSFLLI